ncbi:hypothetical protein BD310DRAFT_917442 [Dichomitus squalens]|uniref:Uncharacterized protein n=1 Tax=Dichomitus squalens TaxID=114155 RepID=A0A4Q9Q716_9APHY|nr:hypothetical protein BD310DRAFT_917442 [Dichomitus squalens]
MGSETTPPVRPQSVPVSMTSVRRRRNSGFAPKLGSRRKDCQAQKRMETAPTPHHTHHMKWMGCKSTLFLFIVSQGPKTAMLSMTLTSPATIWL